MTETTTQAPTTTDINWALLASAVMDLATSYNRITAWHDLCNLANLTARTAGESPLGPTAAAIIGNKRPPAKTLKWNMYDAASRIQSILGVSGDPRPRNLDQVGEVLVEARAALMSHLHG